MGKVAPVVLSFLIAMAPQNSLGAVEVTCVCSKYTLQVPGDSNSRLVLSSHELFRTTQVVEMKRCNDGKHTKIISGVHFNCRGVAKEDLAFDQDEGASSDLPEGRDRSRGFQQRQEEIEAQLKSAAQEAERAKRRLETLRRDKDELLRSKRDAEQREWEKNIPPA